MSLALENVHPTAGSMLKERGPGDAWKACHCYHRILTRGTASHVLLLGGSLLRSHGIMYLLRINAKHVAMKYSIRDSSRRIGRVTNTCQH
jgi:hypothetical protein